MAQLAAMTLPIPTRAERLYAVGDDGLSVSSVRRDNARLYFPSETKGLRTRFRTYVCQAMFEEAIRIASSEIESFELSVWSHPGEEDSWTLVLTIFVESGWDRVHAIRRGLLDYVFKLSHKWTAEQKEDYIRRIHFEVFPTQP